VSDSIRVLFPLRDHNPRTRFPAVTLLLIAANAVAFLFELSLDARGQNLLVLSGGAIPYEIVNWVDIGPRNLLPLPGSIFTSMFLHGGWMHLIGNMWFLWIFGDNVEERLGAVRFVIFYLVVGIVGALAQCYSMPSSTAPMIGASGAVAGALGGYVMLFPRAKVVTFVGIPFLWHIRDVPAWIFLGIWFLGQFFIPGSGVAWMAHVGGFLAGLGAVRLLARTRPRPPAAEVEYLPPPRRRDGWS
jgi:membrane associated rhomboid family serine protease